MRTSRRELLAGAGSGLLVLSGLPRAAEAIAAALPQPLPDPKSVRRTIEAFADTIVPGPAGGGDREPGAIEAGVVDELYDPFYGVRDAFPFMHEELQLAPARVLRRAVAFDLQLPYEDREKIVLERITATGDRGMNPSYVLYLGTATLVYLSYYGTARSEVGPKYIGFPPRSDGYAPEHTYGVEFQGMTEDGNPP